MRVRLGAPLCFKFCKSCSSLWRLLTLLAPPPWFSSATEGLMTATQSGATSRQLQFLQGRGVVVKWTVFAASTLCPCSGLEARSWAAACESPKN